MDAIEISKMGKRYSEKGKPFWALNGVDLKIKKGQAFGLLGPNGAGKSTLINILATIVTPTSGTAKVMGHDILTESNKVKSISGICMGHSNFYWDFNAREILSYFGRLYGMDSTLRKKRANELIKKLGILKYQNKEFSQLSTGMRQKIAVAKSLLNDPEILLLDEPTSGLDVEVALDVRNFILDIIQERDMTVLLTSHQMGEVEHMCKRIAIIDKGMLLTDGRISEIRKSLKFHDIIRIQMDSYDNIEFLKKIRGIIHFGISDALYITVESGKDQIIPILESLKKKNRAVRDIEVKKLSLEEVFLTLVGKHSNLPVKMRGEKHV